LKATTHYTPSDSGQETTVGLKYGSPQLGPLRLFKTIDFNFDNKVKRLFKVSLSSRIKDDYHLGVKFEHDLEKFTALLG